MTNIQSNSYTIRNYLDDDADQIGKMDFILMLAYRYNGDYDSRNIFCAVNENDTILAVGHLVPDQTWFSINNDTSDFFIHKLNLDIVVNDDLPLVEGLETALYKALLRRAQELRHDFPNKKVVISHTIQADELKEMNFYLSKGFVVHNTHLIMKRDLTKEIPEVVIPKNIRIVNWKMNTVEEQEKYLEAEAVGDLQGVAWSLNHLQWTKQGGEWDTFTAFYNDEVVGSVMTWGLGEERSATENIFVLPGWRRQGIAKAVITESLKFLRDQKGKSMATLGVFGDNAPAIALYSTLGYEMFETILEFGLEI